MSENMTEREEEVELLDLLIVLAKHKRVIFRVTGIVAILAVVVSLLLPKIYTASTTILPPHQNESMAAAMIGQLGALAGLAGAGIPNSTDLYLSMLKSRNIEADMIKRFNLKALYKANTEDDARKSLEGNTIASVGKDGCITIAFSDKDPKRAATIANAFVDELDRVSSSLAVTEASQRRLFFEKQLNIVKDNLAKAEFDLQTLQAKTGLIRDYPQEKEIAESNAKLRAEITAKEVQLAAMSVGVTNQNPDYLRLKSELESLKKRVGGSGDNEISVASMPGQSMEYIEKFRNVKYNQAILEMLYKQYELAKIDEAKDYPMIQVLDKAVPPERKSKPRRSLIVIMSTLAAFFLSVVYVFFRDALEKANADPKRSGKLSAFRGMISMRGKPL